MNDPGGRKATAALGAVVLAALVLGYGAWTLSADNRGEGSLERRCEAIAVGDGVAAVFASMGPHDYRPGCGHRAPCDQLDLGEVGSFDWLCDPDDCSLLWRSGKLACLIGLDPETHVVDAVDLTEWGGY